LQVWVRGIKLAEALHVVPLQAGVDRQTGGVRRCGVQADRQATSGDRNGLVRSLRPVKLRSHDQRCVKPADGLGEHVRHRSFHPGASMGDQRPAHSLRRPAVGVDGVTRITAHLEHLPDSTDALTLTDWVPPRRVRFLATQLGPRRPEAQYGVVGHDSDLPPAGARGLVLEHSRRGERHEDGAKEHDCGDPSLAALPATR
jgi:hypothetical protein